MHYLQSLQTAIKQLALSIRACYANGGLFSMESSQDIFFVSVLIPICNEAENLKQLHEEILYVCRGLKRQFEIIFINDGSTDTSLSVMKTLTPLTIINFQKNFGQTAAIDAGIKAAKGEVVVIMDGDLQNDPKDIPALLSELGKGFDVISGWRKQRKDSLSKRFVSRVAYGLRKFLIDDGIHDSGCSLKAYRRHCFETIDLFGEMHRFIPAVLKLKGFRIGEVEVTHRPRVHGMSKYGWKRTVKGFLDMISVWFWKKFANRPLHLFGGVGLMLVFFSCLVALVVVYRKFFLAIDLSETVLTEMAMFGFLGGIQFLVFGLLADILSKTYYASSRDRSYVIREVIHQLHDTSVPKR